MEKRMYSQAAKVCFHSIFHKKWRTSISFVLAALLSVCIYILFLAAGATPVRTLMDFFYRHADSLNYISLTYFTYDYPFDSKMPKDPQAYAEIKEFSDVLTSFSGTYFDMNDEKIAECGWVKDETCLPLSEDTFYYKSSGGNPAFSYSRYVLIPDSEGSTVSYYYRTDSYDIDEYDARYMLPCPSEDLYTMDVVVVDGEEIPIGEYLKQTQKQLADLVGYKIKLYSVFLEQYAQDALFLLQVQSSIDESGLHYCFKSEQALLEAKAKVPVLTFGGIVRSRAEDEQQAWKNFSGYLLSEERTDTPQLISRAMLVTYVAINGKEDVQTVEKVVRILQNDEECIGVVDWKEGTTFDQEVKYSETGGNIKSRLEEREKEMDNLRVSAILICIVLSILYLILTSQMFFSAFATRRRDFALMRAMGVPRKKIFLYCLVLVGILSAVSFVVGAAASYPLPGLLNTLTGFVFGGSQVRLFIVTGWEYLYLFLYVVGMALPLAGLCARNAYDKKLTERLREE